MSKGYSAKSGDRTKKSALVNGRYAKDVLLPWESREEFEELLADLREEFHPDGRMEEETVFDLAYQRWQKQRNRALWHAAAYKDPFVIDIIQSGKKSWSGIRDYLSRHAKDIRSGITYLDKMVSELMAEALSLGVKLKEGGLGKSETDEIQQQLKAIVEVLTDFVVPMMQPLQNGPRAENTLHRVYSPEHLEPVIRLEASIDARIDKLLARLVNLKEYKRLAASSNKPLQIPGSGTSDPKTTRSQPEDHNTRTINHSV